MVERCWAGEPKKLVGKTRNIERIVCKWQNGRKRGQPARYLRRQGASSVSRCGPDMYSSDIIGSYIFFKTAGDGWQFARVIGLAEDADSEVFPHTIKMLDWGKRRNVHLRRDQLKTPDVSGDLGTWCWHPHPRGS